MGVVEARLEIAEVIGNIDGIRKSADRIPENLPSAPFVAAHLDKGSYVMGPAGMTTALHDLMIEVHVIRRDLTRDYDTLEALCDPICIALQSRLKDSEWENLQTFRGISYILEPAEYGDKATLALFITLHEVKIQTAL